MQKPYKGYPTMAETNFVVVSQPRCGTTFFIRSLSTHPEVFCDNELFNPLKIVRLEACNDSPDIAFREKCPLKFFNDYYTSEFSKKFKAIGFNFMMGQHVSILDEIINNEDIKIIYLERENRLAQAVSWFTALATKEWATFEEGKKSGKQIFYFGRYIQQIRKCETFDMLFKRAIENRKNTLHIFYTEVLHIETLFPKVADFLGVTNAFKPDRLKKQGNPDILERFSNKQEVEEFLALIGKDSWKCE